MSATAMVLLSLFCSLCSGCGGGGDKPAASVITAKVAILTWDAPTLNIHGKALTGLAGFKIYYGKSSRDYTEKIVLPLSNAYCTKMDHDTQCTYTIEGLSSGISYFAVTAYDKFGNESDYSNEMSKKIE